MAKLIKTNKWKYNANYIFTQLETFIQRCTKLKEICEVYFLLAKNGSYNIHPEFGGSQTTEIEVKNIYQFL